MTGDMGNGTLTWASPIGWGQEMQPWGANRWWPLGLMVLLLTALLAVRPDRGTPRLRRWAVPGTQW